MKKRLCFISAFVLYLALITVLLRFDLVLMLQPLPLISVLAGIVILTLFRYKKGMTLYKLITAARWNSLFSGALTTLFSLLSSLSGATVNIETLLQKLIPLIYGSIAYMLFHLALSFMSNEFCEGSEPGNVLHAEVAIPVLKRQGFSERECHVALKLLEGLPNKQIASQLYISESTVKKHIQNLFRKCGAEDRHDFIRLYMQWSKDSH